MSADNTNQRKSRSSGVVIVRAAVSALVVAASLAACVGGAQQNAGGSKTSTAVRQDSLQAERAMAVNAVANLMGRYSFYSLANAYDSTSWTNLFANGDPDLRIEISSRGIWEGGDAAQRLAKHYVGQKDNAPPEMGKDWIGVMSLHPMDTAVVEVAGDGQTARSVWMSPGIEAMPVGASWTWVKYCADFKKNADGQWKIWHFLVTLMFRADYDKHWADAPPPRPQTNDPNAPKRGTFASLPFQPDRAPDVNPPTQYAPTSVQRLEPTNPPLPYQTWDDSMACVKRK